MSNASVHTPIAAKNFLVSLSEGLVRTMCLSFTARDLLTYTRSYRHEPQTNRETFGA